MSRVAAALTIGILLLATPVSADSEYLVQDLGKRRIPSRAEFQVLQDHAVADGVAYFFKDDGRHGYELWRSDGSAPGTFLLSDLCPGACGSEQALRFAVESVGPAVYFSANDGVHGSELWITDGTATGTRMVSDLVPGPQSSEPSLLRAVGSQLYFVATEAMTRRRRLWTSDGTEAGTHALFGEFPDPIPGHIYSILPASGVVYVSTDNSQLQLWRTDGSIAGTSLLHSNLGFPASFELPATQRVLADGSLVFQGCEFSPDQDCELWRTDGSVAGTTRIVDLAPGGSSSFPAGFQLVGTEVWFQASSTPGQPKLFRTDGTPSGTDQIPAPPGLEMRSTDLMAARLPSGLVFTGCDAVSGCEPWFTDGVTTFQLGDLVPGSASSIGMSEAFDRPRLTELGDVVVFIGGDDVWGGNLWRTNGTIQGTYLLSDLGSPPSGSSFGWIPAIVPSMVADGQWLLPLFRPDSGLEIWSSDGSEGGTAKVATLAGESSAFFTPVNSSGTLGRRTCVEPLRQGMVTKVANLESIEAPFIVFADGVPDAVELLTAAGPSGFGATSECHSNGAEVLVSTTSEVLDTVWRTRGFVGTTEPVLSAVEGHSLPLFERHGERAALVGLDLTGGGQLELMLVSEGDTAPELERIPVSIPFGQLVSAGESIFFAGSQGGLEVSDGVAASSVLIALPGPWDDPSELQDLRAAGSSLFFVHVTWEEGPELWKSDGSIEGTGVVRNLRPGQAGGLEVREVREESNQPLQPRLAALTEGRIVFPGNDGTTGVELWTSDGTEEGTLMVTEIAPGPDGSWPRHLVSLGDGVVLFAAEDPTLGYELFRTDGTAAGTSMVRDLVVGPGSSVPDDFVIQDGVLYFSAWTPSHGREAWRSDGTFAGTYRLTDVAPGPLSSSPSRFVRRGNRLFFTATDQVHGFELWARADDGSVPLFIDGFETGDAGRWSAQNP
ncbi:MAG: hypothetical protein AMXMBFR36_01770 [Acidobacteriota bacterium]